MKIQCGSTPNDIVLHDGDYLTDLDPTDVVEIFQTPLTGTYNWDYTVQDNRVKKLYELGKQLNWNAETDVDWTPEFKEITDVTWCIKKLGNTIILPCSLASFIV